MTTSKTPDKDHRSELRGLQTPPIVSPEVLEPFLRRPDPEQVDFLNALLDPADREKALAVEPLID